MVLTLAISDNGQVVNVTPTYASRPGRLGEMFAREVSTWRWDAHKVKKVSPFWRATVQFALRCVSRPPPEALDSSLWAETWSWLKARGLMRPSTTIDTSHERLLTTPGEAEVKGPARAVLDMAASRAPKGEAEALAMWSRFEDAGAPPAAYALLIERLVARESTGVSGVAAFRHRQAALYPAWIERFRQRFPKDPALAVLLLNEVFARESTGDFVHAQPLLDAVLASGVAEDDPVRRVALLHRAIGLDRAGDANTAKVMLQRSQLTSDECSIFDTHPIPQTLSANSSDFPTEALRWRFEGYVQEAFDIAADGHVTNVRAVMVYPPYIFEDATNLIAKRFRFIPPRLGGEVVGCGGQVQGLNFKLAQ